MKGSKRAVLAAWLAMVTAIVCAAPAFAEGSKEMTAADDTNAYRPYIEWRDRTQMDNMESESVIYVYAKANETVYFGSSVSSASKKSIAAITASGTPTETQINAIDNDYEGSTIAVTLPISSTEPFDPSTAKTVTYAEGSTIESGTVNTNTVYLFKPDGDTGVIKNPAQEQAGPKINETTVDGYAPLSFKAPITGTYSFRFLSSEYGEKDQYTAAPTEKATATVKPTTTAAPETTLTPLPLNVPVTFEDVTATSYPADPSTVIKGYAELVGGSNVEVATCSPEVTFNGKTYKTAFYGKGPATATETPDGTTPSKRYIRVVPEAAGYINVVWGAGDGNRAIAIQQGGKIAVSKTNKNYTGVFSMAVTEGTSVYIYPATANETWIYSIELTSAAVTEAPTADPSATETPTPTPTPTAVPTPTPTAEPEGTPESGSAATVYSLGGDYDKTVIEFGAATPAPTETSYKLDAWKDSNPSRYIKFTPPQNGLIQITAQGKKPRCIYINTDIPTSENYNSSNNYKYTFTSNTDTEETTAEKNVLKNSPIYIYNGEGYVTYQSITFTPSTTSGEESLSAASYSAAAYAETAEEPTATANILPLERKVGEQWAETPSLVAAWDITVVDEDGKVQNGRVWSDILFLNAGAHKMSVYSKFYILTNDGYEYKFDLNGMQPYSFVFYSNSRGFLVNRGDKNSDNDWQPFMHSYFSVGDNSSVGTSLSKTETDNYGNPVLDADNQPIKAQTHINYTPKTEVDYTNRIFFNTPATEAVKAYTDKGALATPAAAANPLEGVTPVYEGAGTAAGTGRVEGVSYGTTGAGGAFKFELTTDSNKNNDINKAKGIYYFDEGTIAGLKGKTFRVKLDFSGYALNDNGAILTDGNGAWQTISTDTQSDAEKNNIVILSTTINGADSYELVWDGKDNHGNVVPEGVYGGTDSEVISTYLEEGSVHFPLIDVERAPNGVKIERLNNMTDDDDKYNLYYNNEASANSWYFSGTFDGLKNDASAYPSKIGDGKNATAGVSTETDGAPQFSDYSGDDVKFIKGKDSDGKDSDGKISDNEAAYGNYCAIDLWSRYVSVLKSNALTIGVQDTMKIESKANVSYVQANEKTYATETPFTKSHVQSADGTRTDIDTIGDGGIDARVFGNTISTGFTSAFSLNSGTINLVKWDIKIPEGSYIKKAAESGETATTEDESATSESGKNAWETDNNPVLTDDGDVIYNKGSIYKLSGEHTLKLEYTTATITANGGKVVWGIAFDNLYAPDAVATAEYISDNESSSEDYTTLDDNNSAEVTTYDGFLKSSKNGYENARNKNTYTEEGTE